MNMTEAVARYGPIENDQWANETKWCGNLVIPNEIGCTWIKSATGNPVQHIYCNKDLSVPLTQALLNVKNRGLLSQLKTFDGCYMVRAIRGQAMISTHCYAMAIDINAAENKLGETPTLSPELVKCFTDMGFLWGGNFKRQDGMHFQYGLDW